MRLGNYYLALTGALRKGFLLLVQPIRVCIYQACSQKVRILSRLEKFPKVVKSNHSAKSAKASANLCAQVPHPQSF